MPELSSDLPQRLAAAVAAIKARDAEPIEIGMVLGSGLGGLAAAVEPTTVIPYREIDGFPHSTSPGHAGNLVLGRLAGRRVGLLQGRFHLFEGWGRQDIALPVYALRRLGAAIHVVTNAAGGLNPDYAQGDVMLIEDHINFTGTDPLMGPNDETIGPRFPDMSRAYDPELRAAAKAKAAEMGMKMRAGIYAGLHGPALETSAERRFLRLAGADAVGMSTVLEVIAANHCGLKVLGFSAITNMATGGPEQQPDTAEAILAEAAITGKKIGNLLEALLPTLGRA